MCCLQATLYRYSCVRTIPFSLKEMYYCILKNDDLGQCFCYDIHYDLCNNGYRCILWYSDLESSDSKIEWIPQSGLRGCSVGFNTQDNVPYLPIMTWNSLEVRSRRMTCSHTNIAFIRLDVSYAKKTWCPPQKETQVLHRIIKHQMKAEVIKTYFKNIQKLLHKETRGHMCVIHDLNHMHILVFT